MAMSRKNQLYLKGSQAIINPKPTPRNGKSRSTSSNASRPYSATHIQKFPPPQCPPNSPRPKSANDISFYEDKEDDSYMTSSTKSVHFDKVIPTEELNSFDSHSSYPDKETNANDYEESPVHLSRHRLTSYSSSKSHCERLMGMADEKEKYLWNTKGFKKASIASLSELEERECSPSSHWKENSLDGAELSEMKSEKNFEFMDKKAECDEEGDNLKVTDITSIENSLASLLGEVNSKSISYSSTDSLKNEEKDLESEKLSNCSSFRVLPCHAKNLGLSSNSEQIEKFSKLDDSYPNFNVDTNCKYLKMLVENNVKHEQCDNEGSKMLSDFSSNSGQESMCGLINSQLKHVSKILKASKENLQENLEKILDDQKDSFHHSEEFEKYNTEVLFRPSCLGESSRIENELFEMKKSDRQIPVFPETTVTNLLEDLPDTMEKEYQKFNCLMRSIENSMSNNDPPTKLIKKPYSDEERSEEHTDSSCNEIPEELDKKQMVESLNLDFVNGENSDDDSTYDEILSALKVLEKEERVTDILTSRPPPTGSESENTPRIAFKDILSFLDTVDESCNSLYNSVTKDPIILNNESGSMTIESEKQPKKFEMDFPSDLASSSQILNMRLEEQAKGLSLLKKELEETKQNSMKERENLRKSLKEEHAKVVERHQTLIEKLLSEKKTLQEKCESLVSKLCQLEESHKRNIAAMEEHHTINLRSERQRLQLEHRAARDKWMREKVKKIQATTAKGAEGEVNRLVTEQAYQIEALWRARLDELRGRLEREAEEGMAKERENARKRLEERLEELERFHQGERRKFLSEECLLRGRAEEAERKVREVEEEARRNRSEDLDAERSRSQAKLEKATQDMEKFYQTLLSKEKEKREASVESARKEERDLLNAEWRKWEAKLRDKLKMERDEEVDKVVLHLSTQAEKAQNEAQSRAEMALRHMREQCEEQVRIAEMESEKQKKQCVEASSHSLRLQEEVASLKATVARLEQELQTSNKMTNNLYEERAQIREMVVEEWSARVAALREEVGTLKAQIAGEKEYRAIELAQSQREREKELMQVQKRVELAVKKKEDAICHLKTKYENVLKRCSQLQELLEKQRKDLLLK